MGRLVDMTGGAASGESDINKLAVDLAKMIGPVPYAAGVVTRAAGEDNPLANKRERATQEKATAMDVSLYKGYSGY